MDNARKPRGDQEIRERMIKAMPMSGVPQAAQDLVWHLSWEMGHASGEHEVAMYYDDLRAVALLAASKREQ